MRMPLLLASSTLSLAFASGENLALLRERLQQQEEATEVEAHQQQHGGKPQQGVEADQVESLPQYQRSVLILPKRLWEQEEEDRRMEDQRKRWEEREGGTELHEERLKVERKERKGWGGREERWSGAQNTIDYAGSSDEVDGVGETPHDAMRPEEDDENNDDEDFTPETTTISPFERRAGQLLKVVGGAVAAGTIGWAYAYGLTGGNMTMHRR